MNVSAIIARSKISLDILNKIKKKLNHEQRSQFQLSMKLIRNFQIIQYAPHTVIDNVLH